MATGIATVDEQHQRLIEIFNRIALAQAEGASQVTVATYLDELVDYTDYHFREEERLMHHWRADSRHRRTHLQAHESFREFLRQAREFVNEHAAAGELLAFLGQWLVHHILEVDRQLAHEIHARQEGDAAHKVALALADGAGADVAQTVSHLTAQLGKRTFALIEQQQQFMNLQVLYRALLDCGDVLIHSREEHEMLQSLCVKLVQDAPFHTAWIGRPGNSDALDALAIAGNDVDQTPTALLRLTDQGSPSPTVAAWYGKESVVCNDTLADGALRLWHTEFAARRWISVLAIPIIRAGQRWAILVLGSSRRGSFDAPMIEVCSRIVELLGHGLDELDAKERTRAQQLQVTRVARTDALTGLPNRWALDEYLPQAIARARRRGTSLAVGVIDLDDFKPVNDQFGHEAGDELLRRLSHGLLEWLRDSDLIARLGGDEFIVILEDLDTTTALYQLDAALTRLHRAVEAPFHLDAGQAVSIDMSMGVAVYPADGAVPQVLLRNADASMYKVKRTKARRAKWWSVGLTSSPEQIDETSFDAFGAEARELMRALSPQLESVAEKFSGAFYRELQSHPESAELLASLSTAEYRSLSHNQAAHLSFLLDEHITAPQIRQTSKRLGAIHALVGVSSATMMRALGIYRDLLRTHLDAVLITARRRYRTLRTAEARLQLDVETQLQAMQSTLDQYQMLLAHPIAERASMADWTNMELKSLAALPGIRVAVLVQPDDRNRLVIEHATGECSAAFVEAHRARDLYPVLDPRDDRSHALAAKTWMTDSQQETVAYTKDSRLQPWHELMREFGIRSAVGIPIHRRGTIHAVLMLFGAYQNQFASGFMRTWRLSLQSRWDLLITVANNHLAVTGRGCAAQIRSLLYGGGVEMFVQPIMNLATGALVKVEALARLRTPDGGLLAPAEFLPVLAETDLDALFREGLAQTLDYVRHWRVEKLDIGVSINLAPSSLVHPDCARWVEEALNKAQVAPEHLTLELLESQALMASAADEAIARLASSGVRIALDDLGAGFSNLKRLAELPFHVIKVDQSIVKDLTCDPIKALSLIRTAAQIGDDLGRAVIAEGLEDAGLIEAARLLGCGFGQGYGLARPMPADALANWVQTRELVGEQRGVHSWTGALAVLWLSMRNPLHVRRPGELEGCWITKFFETQEVNDSRVFQWHWQSHEDPDESARLQAMGEMLQWIVHKIQETS